MKIKTITGHLTATNKTHIKKMFELKLFEAKINTITYLLREENNIYTVFTIQRDNDVLIGQKIRKSKSTFKIV